MADLEPTKITAENKLVEELGVLARFLDPNLKPRTDAKPTAGPGVWSWRKTIAFILVTGLIGWSMVLGVVYLLFSLWN
ncbi:MAG TPA: hypothetical protein VN175_16015 [Rhizomicrobium sp.]|nr:hypothetical protein [Rhizomicrobium sp.]